MTVQIDISAAVQASRMGESLLRGEAPKLSDWRELYRTAGVKALLEGRIKGKREIREFLESAGRSGSGITFPDSERLAEFAKSLGACAAEALEKAEKWFPSGFSGEDILLCLALYGGETEDTDPPVLDAVQALGLESSALGRTVAKMILTLLLKRHQNLERYYLKNFLPIRRHMDFIYVLWEIQINGLLAVAQGNQSTEEPEEDFSVMDNLLSAAARADKSELVMLGKRFRKEVDTEKTGRALYRLWEGEAGKIVSSLDKPTTPWLLLRRDGQELFCGEAAFFLDQLNSLLS